MRCDYLQFDLGDFEHFLDGYLPRNLSSKASSRRYLHSQSNLSCISFLIPNPIQIRSESEGAAPDRIRVRCVEQTPAFRIQSPVESKQVDSMAKNRPRGRLARGKSILIESEVIYSRSDQIRSDQDKWVEMR